MKHGMTERLFDEDAYQKGFEATVLSKSDVRGMQTVVLDRTLFYPASGGQPADKGFLGGAEVVDVVEEEGIILHVVNGEIGTQEKISGKIDWDRRFDHMQQHTGQHILSQSLLRSIEAMTVGFHLGADYATIDLDKADISDDDVRRTERIANGVIFDNRDVHIGQVTHESEGSLPLRKPPKKTGTVRVVEIEGFDRIACCGTHVRKTGEVGIVKVVRMERYKGGTRVTFRCGGRALKDYQDKTDILGEVCRMMTAGQEDVLSSLNRWKDEVKSVSKKIRSLREELLGYEVGRLVEEAENIGCIRVVRISFEDRDPDEVQELVKRLIRSEHVVALIGLKTDRAYLYFGKSANVDADMTKLLETACEEIEGKGGGSSAMARGSGQKISGLNDALDKAMRLFQKGCSSM
ncbi:MAG: DHHA1 domain-containing protein [bacterium]